METINKIQLKEGHVLVLCSNDKNNCSRHGIQFPRLGIIEDENFYSQTRIGGLEGMLKGCGNGHLLNYSEDSIWSVLEVSEQDIIEYDGFVRFRMGTILYSGNMRTAATIISNVYGNIGVIGLEATTGDIQIITGGYMSNLTGGNNCLIKGGGESILKGGDDTTIMGGHNSTITGGNSSVVYADKYCEVKVGEDSIIIGDYGTIASGGNNTTIILKNSVGKSFVAKVGENGLRPNVYYTLDINNNFSLNC